MKKLFCLLLIIICSATLWSCALLPQSTQCTVHIDNDGNLQCDVCGTLVECTQHRDNNEDLKCDSCQAAMTCTHRDVDNNGVCDVQACSFVLCEHEYEDEYSHNRTYHYYESTCGCDIEPKDKEEHEDDDNNGVCDVCEWDYNHKHSYANVWSHDKDNHWYAVTCDHDIAGKNLAPHSDEDKDGICDGCLWNYDHEHTFSSEWAQDENDHWHAVTCEHEIDVKDRAAHTDANNDGACDVCGWDNGHEHTYNENVWRFDEDNHWYAPTCNHDIIGKDFAPHADEDDDGLCDECGYVVCDNHEIDYTADWQFDATTHWRPSKCGHASAMMEAAGHSMDTEGRLCTICGYDSNHQHEFSEEWTSDLENHWHVSTCHSFVTTEKEAHVDEDNNGVCDVCEKQFCEHTYSEEWSHDTDYHWHAATCGHDVEPKDKAAHADENNDGICEGCAWNYDHEHQFAENWSHDADYHWHDVACSHTIEVADKAAHADENNDSICDGCGWDYDHVHTYDETDWAFDLENHFYAPTCGHNVPGKDVTPHTDENNDGFCEVCEKQYCEHEFSEDWSHDNDNHWHATVCTHSGEIKDLAPHADENNDGICDGCAWNYDHEHQFAENWSHDADYHWHDVACTHTIEVADKAAHADENNDGICDGCEWNYDHEHQFAESWSHDAEYHWHDVACSHTIEVADKAAHADENNDGICDGCEWNYDHEHTYKTEFSKDTIYHWHDADCGHDVAPSGKEEHTDANGDGICEVCNLQFCDHPYSEEWTFDGKYHWHAVSCPHSEQPVADKAEHYDETADGLCDACGRSMTCEHTYDTTEWKHNETHHWYAPTCGHDENDTIDTRVPHTDADGDMNCDICESAYSSTTDGDINEDNAIVTPDHVLTAG